MKEDEAIIYISDRNVSRPMTSRTRPTPRRAQIGEKDITDIQALASYYGVTAMALTPRREKTARRRTQAANVSRRASEVVPMSVVSSWPRLANDWICETRWFARPVLTSAFGEIGHSVIVALDGGFDPYRTFATEGFYLETFACAEGPSALGFSEAGLRLIRGRPIWVPA